MDVQDEDATIAALRHANRLLREELGMHALDSEGQTEEWLERENAMLCDQIKILDENRRLIETPESRSELLFLLQFFRAIPLPIWTSDVQAIITSWNPIAARTYGYKVKQAIGKNFIDLFVSAPEQEQAWIDLRNIIAGQEGLEHFNLCKDKDQHNQPVYLSTCCFPVFDPRVGEIMQAEVSIDLRNLKDLEQELNELHEKYSEKEEQRRVHDKTVREQLIEQMFDELKTSLRLRRMPLDHRAERSKEALSDSAVGGELRAEQEEALREIHEGIEKLEFEAEEIQRELGLASDADLEQLHALMKRIRQFRNAM